MAAATTAARPTVGGTPFLDPRFTVSMFVPDKSKEKDPESVGWIKTSDWVQDKIRAATDMMEKNSTSKRPILPGFFPVAANNRLVFRTYDGVYAFHIRDDAALNVKAGELAWAQPTEGSLFAMGTDNGGFKGTFEGWWGQFWGSMQSGAMMPGILFENSAVGTLSHDNTLVYYVDDLAMPPHPNQTMYGFNGSASPFAAFTDKVVLTRCAPSRWRPGLKWRSAGASRAARFPSSNRRHSPNECNGKVVRIMVMPMAKSRLGRTASRSKRSREPAAVRAAQDSAGNEGFRQRGRRTARFVLPRPPLPIGGRSMSSWSTTARFSSAASTRTARRNARSCRSATARNWWRQPLGTANFS